MGSQVLSLWIGFLLAGANFLFASPAHCTKMDYSSQKPTVTDPDSAGSLTDLRSTGVIVDGIGAEPYPISGNSWGHNDAPRPGKPVVLIFDYQTPVKVAALAHYFYLPGCRDLKGPMTIPPPTGEPERANDPCSGPSAFREMRIYAADEATTESWKEVAHLTELPTGCPQLLKIEKPVSTRYLKLEILSLAEGAGAVRTYEIETYLDDVPTCLPSGDKGKAVRFGFPKSATAPAGAVLAGRLANGADPRKLAYTLPATGLAKPLSGCITAVVDGKPIVWKDLQKDTAQGEVEGGVLTLHGQFVKAGLLLTLDWQGRITPRFPKLHIAANLDAPASEWSIPSVHYSRTAPGKSIEFFTAGIMNCFSAVGDTTATLGLVPDTDQSWLGLNDQGVTAAFPLRGETQRVLLLAAPGDWTAIYRKAIVEVFDFNEPRQFMPVSQATEEICNFLMGPSLWSEKFQMIRSFPDTDFFYIFYTLPYAIPALSYWEALTDDPIVQERVDKILRFSLARRITHGGMKGSLFSEYATQEQAETGTIPFGPRPTYFLPDETLVGLDQSCNRWITSHNMGTVLWTITQVWRLRGNVPDDIKAGVRDVADWLVTHMGEDGSWPYAYHPDGRVANPESDSGAIWNVWALYRYGQLTGEKKYSEAAAKSLAYFKKTFTEPHIYRGYWEDHYIDGRLGLDTGQGYEASIAAMAYSEMGDNEAMVKSTLGCLPFICTRVLESRTYETCYGQAAETTGCGPGTYMAPTIGRAAQLCYQYNGDELFRRQANIATSIGWWQDPEKKSGFWLSEAFWPAPIEIYREQEGATKSFWAMWDSAQKVTYIIPWMADLIKERTGGKIAIDVANLQGVDDRGSKVAMTLFKGKVASVSGQVNWMGLKPLEPSKNAREQLILINHAEATDVTIQLPDEMDQGSARLIDGEGNARKAKVEQKPGVCVLAMPEKTLAVLSWEKAK